MSDDNWIYTPKYLAPYEVVDKKTFSRWGYASYRFINPNILKAADWLRERLGKITVNDWKWGGNSQWRGLRTTDSDYYLQYSAHSFGDALDISFQDHSAQYVRDYIVEHWDEFVEETGITSITLEKDVSWVHISAQNNKQGINFFSP